MGVGSVSWDVGVDNREGINSRLKANCDAETGLLEVGSGLIDNGSGVVNTR